LPLQHSSLKRDTAPGICRKATRHVSYVLEVA